MFMNTDTTQRRKSKPAVLVVDDDPKLRRLVERQLSAEGFDVLLASNGEEALYQASLSRPNLIVLDISMPVMDGFEALERLREFFTDPVIILSATDQEREKVRALDLGADILRRAERQSILAIDSPVKGNILPVFPL